MVDIKKISELTVEAVDAADDDWILLEKANGESEKLKVQTLRQTAFGTSADNNTGVGVGDVVELADAGDGTPTLPAVDARQLVNVPIPTPVELDAGMNEGQLGINETIDADEFGFQWGIADIPEFKLSFQDNGDGSFTQKLTDTLEQGGVYFTANAGATTAILFSTDLTSVQSSTKVSINAPLIEYGANVQDVTFVSAATINNAKNISYANDTDDVGFNELDLGGRKITSIVLTADLTITGIVGGLANSYVFLIVEQGAGGNWNIVGWPANVVFLGGTQPTFSGEEGDKQILLMFYDGTNYYVFPLLTAADIKSAYESNADTNAFTDAYKALLDLITVVNPVDLDFIRDRVAELDASVILKGGWDASSYAATSGYQIVDMGGSVSGVGDPTGLANDATVYTAEIIKDGATTYPISIIGSEAQTINSLFSKIGLATSFQVNRNLENGNLRFTSNTSGATSTIQINDTDLFNSLTGYIGIDPPVDGLDEKLESFPGDGYAQTGWSYQVTVAGTVDGVDFSVNDRVIALVDNASEDTYADNWLKADYSDSVSSIFGRTGLVVAQSGDYTADQITETATGKIMTDVERTKLSHISVSRDVDLDNLAENSLIPTVYKNIFMADLGSEWILLTGTDPEASSPVYNPASNAVELDTGDDAAASMAVNGSQMVLRSGRFFPGSTGGIFKFEANIQITSATNVCLFLGMTDSSTLEMPFEMDEYDTLISNASSAIGFLYDTQAASDVLWAVGVSNDVDATPVDLSPYISFGAGTEITIGFEIDDNMDVTIYLNGSAVDTMSLDASGAGQAQFPTIAIFSREAAQKVALSKGILIVNP